MQKFSHSLKQFLIIMLVCIMSSCGVFQKNIDTSTEYDASYYYQEAQKAMQSRSYDRAIQYYELLEARYPFGEYATKGQKEIIEAYYKAGESTAVVAAADRFIRLHPNHPELDFAYYMRGLANYTADQNFIQRILPLDMSKRDPGAKRQAFNDFAQLLKRFPNSQYAEEAQKRMVHLRNNLARHEIHVARYYLEQEAYIAANNRAQYVVEKFPKTTYVGEALEIQLICYHELGLDNSARNIFQILELNYPQQVADNNLKRYLPAT